MYFTGSDAEYIPVLIAKLLYPGRALTNIVTCNGEVGSGTLDGAGGRFFSGVVPIDGFTEGDVKAGDDVPGLADQVCILKQISMCVDYILISFSSLKFLSKVGKGMSIYLSTLFFHKILSTFFCINV